MPYVLKEENERRKKQTKKTFLQLIGESEPDGLFTSELASKLDCHPDTVRRIGHELENEDKIFKTGKFGKYHLGSKALTEDPQLDAVLLQKKVRKYFYHFLKQGAICATNEFCNHNQYDRLMASGENRLPSQTDRFHFFEFALRLGAIMTYELLQAIRYNNNLEQNPSGQESDYVKSNTLKNKNMFMYIGNVLSPSSLIHIFRDLYPVTRRIKPEPQDVVRIVTSEEEARKHQLQSKSFPSYLELQAGKFEELEKIYQETFPELFKELETIRTVEIPKEIDIRKQQIECR